MLPHPHVAQNQSDAHEQQPQQWAAGRRADPDFVHLAIAGFDAEAFAVGLVNSLERPWIDSPIGVQVCPPSVAFSCPRIVLADDGERHGGAPILFACPTVATPAAAFARQQFLQAAGSRRFGTSAAGKGGHQKRAAIRLQVANHLDIEKPLSNSTKRTFTPIRRTCCNSRLTTTSIVSPFSTDVTVIVNR